MPMTEFEQRLLDELQALRRAVEKNAPADPRAFEPDKASCFVWQDEPAPGWVMAVEAVNAIGLPLIQGVDAARDQLLENTRQFADGLPANNVLLWGARGMGKSSLVKAVHGELTSTFPRLKLVEIHREDIDSLPALLRLCRQHDNMRFILFCDDLSFGAEDSSYKSLKAALEGGVEGRPDNVVFYATSNRRHLMAREMIDNERSTAIAPGEAVEEKVSLSDRFGLWLGFHKCDQETYLKMVDGYAAHFDLPIASDELRRQALQWAAGRGGRSGRVAWQFIQHLAGRLGRSLKPRRG